MKKSLILKELTSKVLSEMCFLYEETPPDEFDEDYFYYSQVDNEHFIIRILYPDKIALSVAENLLGIDEELEDEDIVDALKEILNLVVGHFICQCYPNYQQLLPIPVSSKINHSDDLADNFSENLLFYSDFPVKVLLKELS